jgi:transaldolase
MAKFLLDSGDPQEYKEIAELAQKHGQELWGSTTNPSLIAKKLAGQKVTFEDAFSKLQRQIVEEILEIVPGAVSAEVYASKDTSSQNMVDQGRQIATWHKRVVVKLPTTLEGFKARTVLRQEGIPINNTLVFSQEQSFAIALHEKIMIQEFGKPRSDWPCFISPFLGRLDDKGEDGLSFLNHATTTLHREFGTNICWMLAASLRNARHMKGSLSSGCELITSPAKVYQEWFGLSDQEQHTLSLQPEANLQAIPIWQPNESLLQIASIDAFMQALEEGRLNISHSLTDTGIEKFVSDWQQILV